MNISHGSVDFDETYVEVFVGGKKYIFNCMVF